MASKKKGMTPAQKKQYKRVKNEALDTVKKMGPKKKRVSARAKNSSY